MGVFSLVHGRVCSISPRILLVLGLDRKSVV